MKRTKSFVMISLCAVLSLPLTVSQSFSQEASFTIGELRRGRTPPLFGWMNPEIADAWRQGFRGQGAQITVVDDFRSAERDWGRLGPRAQYLRHGEWVGLQAGMTAPSARILAHDFNSNRITQLRRNHLNILNLSYGMFALDGYSGVHWGPQESSIVAHSRSGAAIVVKAAGNDSTAIGAAAIDGFVDYLNRDLIGAQSAIFVGALNAHGTPHEPTQLAWYSNFSGPNPVVQNQFLSVGVRGDFTGLYGTSFATPIVSGYAAVLGSKFRDATPTQIVNRLLETARTDTILGYRADIHGRGEASIARALAPLSIR
jgi:hypothetical protein